VISRPVEASESIDGFVCRTEVGVEHYVEYWNLYGVGEL